MKSVAKKDSEWVIEGLVLFIRFHIPFTSFNTIWRSMDRRSRSILDVGCGEGRPMRFLNRNRRFYAVGIDTFKPYLERSRWQGVYDECLLCNANNLPFGEDSFDTVLCLQVLEHFGKAEGRKLLRTMERIARRQVIISTPVGKPVVGEWFKQVGQGSNPHQEHKAFWRPAELKFMGYRVRGHGLRAIFGAEGMMVRLPKFLRPLADVLWVCVGPFVYFLPELAGDMVCVKSIKRTRGKG